MALSNGVGLGPAWPAASVAAAPLPPLVRVARQVSEPSGPRGGTSLLAARKRPWPGWHRGAVVLAGRLPGVGRLVGEWGAAWQLRAGPQPPDRAAVGRDSTASRRPERRPGPAPRPGQPAQPSGNAWRVGQARERGSSAGWAGPPGEPGQAAPWVRRRKLRPAGARTRHNW